MNTAPVTVIQHHIAADKIHALAASRTPACYDDLYINSYYKMLHNIISLSLSTMVLGFRKSIPSYKFTIRTLIDVRFVIHRWL